MMRKTKIICTLGPASSSDAMLSTLLRGGMDAARFNLHGSHATICHARKAARGLPAGGSP